MDLGISREMLENSINVNIDEGIDISTIESMVELDYANKQVDATLDREAIIDETIDKLNMVATLFKTYGATEQLIDMFNENDQLSNFLGTKLQKTDDETKEGNRIADLISTKIEEMDSCSTESFIVAYLVGFAIGNILRVFIITWLRNMARVMKQMKEVKSNYLLPKDKVDIEKFLSIEVYMISKEALNIQTTSLDKLGKYLVSIKDDSIMDVNVDKIISMGNDIGYKVNPNNGKWVPRELFQEYATGTLRTLGFSYADFVKIFNSVYTSMEIAIGHAERYKNIKKTAKDEKKTINKEQSDEFKRKRNIILNAHRNYLELVRAMALGSISIGKKIPKKKV